MSIDCGGRVLVSFQEPRLTGRRGLGLVRLVFSVGYTVYPRQANGCGFNEIRGQVLAGAKESSDLPLGTALPEHPFSVTAHDHVQNHGILFFLDVSRDAIEAIEEIRRGDNLRFTLKIAGLVTAPDDSRRSAQDELSFEVNQRAWIDILDSIGYGKYLLVEIPLPTNQDTEAAAQALTHLEKARRLIWSGDYSGSAFACRLSLESLTQAVGDEGPLGNAVGAYRGGKESREAMSEEDRFRFAREAIRHVCHPSAHPPASGAVSTFDRADAICILGATTALVSRFARRGHPSAEDIPNS